MQIATQAFLQEGYGVAIRAILDRAGASNSSFFHLFKTKLSLAEALTKDIAAKRHDRILSALAGPGATGRAGMEAALTAVLLWAEDEPDLARLGLILPSRPFSHRSEVTGHAILHQHEIETVRSWAAPLTESGEIKPLPAPLLHALIFGPADLIVRQWLVGRRIGRSAHDHGGTAGGRRLESHGGGCRYGQEI